MNPPSGFLRRTAMRTFRDRREAGRALAEELTSYRDKDAKNGDKDNVDKDKVLVLGLARGGVPVAWEIASALHAALDVFLVRKLGVPRWSELAMGALASTRKRFGTKPSFACTRPNSRLVLPIARRGSTGWIRP